MDNSIMEYFTNQLGGGCHAGAALKRKSCKQYPGPDADDCMVGPSGRCRSGAGLARAYRPKMEATPVQLAALEKARAARAAKRVVAAPTVIQTGSGCHAGVALKRKSCKQYPGPDADDCMVGPSGRCRSGAGLAKAYRPKMAATPAQVAALAKARAVRSAKLAATRTPAQVAALAKARAARAAKSAAKQVGGFWW